MRYDIILFTILVISVVALLAYSFYLTKKNNKLVKMLLEALVDNKEISDALEEAKQQNLALLNIDSSDQTDGFIRFLEETRESAYSYIEKVQGELGAFDKVIRNDINN